MGHHRLGRRLVFGEAVATVDGTEITQVEWDQAHQVESQRLREAMPTLDAKLLDSPEARYATLERLVRDRVLATAAQKLNLFTSDQRLARELQQNEAIAALRKPDGTLDVEAYRALVARQNMTPEMFEARVRADLSQRQVSQSIVGSGFAPAGLANVSLNAFFERREVQVARFNATDYAALVKPTDAEIEAFYNANGPLFQAPEQADFEYLVLDASALQASLTLNEADVRAYYDQNAGRLAGTEERRASHILLKTEGKNEADVKKLADDLAKAAWPVFQQIEAEEIAKAAKDAGVSIRIGVNAGSLDPRLLQKYGKATAEALVESAVWEASLFEEHDFHDFKREGVPAAALAQWLQQAGRDTLINRKGTTWRQLDETVRAGVSDAASAQAVALANPSVIKRPVVQWTDGITVGFDAAAWQARL